ncbi:MAG: sigma-70 family RNA polymerase sigma factor [bacterium]|nr:sigma-70 family RNA polymerase sigma factor [bacterium]
MSYYTPSGQEIEEEYLAVKADADRDQGHLYELLWPYVAHIVAKTIRMLGVYADESIVEDLTQETMLAVMKTGMEQFEAKQALFSTYCGVIAKNKSVDWIRKQHRRWVNEVEISEPESIFDNGADFYNNPEEVILREEYRLSYIDRSKKFLRMFIELPERPQKLVSCCYTLILFQRYHPMSKQLSSPAWSYEQLEGCTVEKGADRFMKEINEWIPYLELYWGDEFLDEMDQPYEHSYVRDIIFSELYRIKDFENWSIRIRMKLKKQMAQQEYRTCMSELS